ncbi:hypothetical protein ACFV4N_05275 [Actinosynnema sp. NPDC059797]
MGGLEKDAMTSAEAREVVENSTPFWYGGDPQTIIAFTVHPEGVSLSLTCFATDEQMCTLITWGEMDVIAADVPRIVASGTASREAGRPIYVGHPGVQRGK